MANINYAIRKGFYDKLVPSGSTTLKTALKQTVSTVDYFKLYYHQAPQFVTGTTALTLPYVVLDILPIDPDRDSGTKLYRCTLQLLVSASTIGNCEDIAGYITDALEDSESTLTFTGYQTVEIRRQPQINLGFIEHVWNIAVQYSIIIQA